MDKGEKRIKQEDCSEDKLGAGILTLTNKRLAFDKTNARIMDFSKHFGDTVLDISLDKVTKTWKEAKTNPRSKLLNYFIQNRLSDLMDCIGDF